MLDPPHGADATLGGIVATNASGPLRHRYGAPRDLVIGARLVLADGTRAKTGGRVVKNVAGYDLARLLCGSLGSIAVITELAFRLHPVPEATRRRCCSRRATRLARRRSRRPSAAPGLAPTLVEVAWPDGRVMVRFDSTPAAAREQALAAAALDPDARALSDSDRRMLVPRLADRPWTDDGAVVGVGVPLAAVADLLRTRRGPLRRPRATRRHRRRRGSAAGRREPPSGCSATPSWRSAVTSRRGALPPGLADLAWPEPDAVSRSLTLAIKQQLDPNGTLAPGRLAEAA